MDAVLSSIDSFEQGYKRNGGGVNKLCQLSDLEDDSSLGFDELGVFVVKYQGQITVYRNECPHLGTPLEFMPNQFLSLDKSFVHCATHGALFEHGSGHCISGPCSGQHLQVLPHRISDGWVCIDP